MIGLASRLLKPYAEYVALAEAARREEQSGVVWGPVPDVEFQRRVARCWARRGTEAPQEVRDG